MDSLNENFINKKIHELPAFRQKQCSQYRRMLDKKTCVMSYLLLKKGLKEQYDITTPILFTYNKHGKPYLKDTPYIFFNISHCKNGVICALSDFEIGVDIQDITPFNKDIANKVCNEEELKQLTVTDNPSKLFCKMWTEKESYAKAKGINITSVFRKNIPKMKTIYIDDINGYISLYCEIPDMKILAYRYSLIDLF